MITQTGAPPDGPMDSLWGFFQHSNGYVFLTMIKQGQPIPILAFVTPAALLDFKEDLDDAIERFIPKTVLQAEEIVRKGWDVDAGSKDSRPVPSDKPVEPPKETGGETAKG